MLQSIRRHAVTTAVCAVLCITVAYAQAALDFDLPRQPLASALRAVGQQANFNVLFDPPVVGEREAPAVQGRITGREALARLLEGTGLGFEFVSERTVAIREKGARQAAQESAGGQGMRLAQAEGDNTTSGGDARPDTDAGEVAQNATNDNFATTVKKKEDEEDLERGGIPEILVTGSKVGTLNTDIRRTEDDIQPYVVFDRERIEKSGVTNLEEFFRNELTMSMSTLTANQAEVFGNRSRIDLRGLGTDETLILIDGRRVAGVNFEGTPQQSGINSIPLAAIERIEVLPTTASGIFGGGATGGAINIVLRRDYSGFTTQLTYGNTFDSDAMSRRVDLSGGFSLEGGRTNVLLSGSYSDTSPLLVGERDFLERGRQHILDLNDGNPEALNLRRVVPPLGATANIRSPSGNLVLDPEFGGANLGSPITHVPVGYAGLQATGDGGAALVANAGRYNLGLAPTAQQNGGRYGLLSGGEVKSLMMTLRREFAPRVQAFLELQGFESSTEYSANFADLTAIILPGSAPINPFQQTILVKVPMIGTDEAVLSESQDRRAVVGVITQLPREWQLATDFTWSRSRFSYVWPRGLSEASVAAVNSGSLDVLRDLNQYPVVWERGEASFQSPADMVLKNVALRLAGPLPWLLPGGGPTLSFLVEHRDEVLDDVIRTCIQCGSSILFPARSQAVKSAYLEAQLPLVSARNRRPALESFELQIALRGDDYRVTGATFVNLAAPAPVERFTNKNSSVDPTVGLRYQPTPDLTFRASYGTGYLPPAITQLVPDPPRPLDLGFADLTDPLRGDEPVGSVEWIQGGNPNLLAEESESESIGVILTPRAWRGLRIAADWSRITKTDNIEFGFNFDQASLETFISHFPQRITRGTPSDGFSVGPIAGVDGTLINIAHLRVEALDLALDYQLETGRIGVFDFSVDATRLLSRETQAAPGAAIVQNAGVLVSDLDGALKWKANSSVNWKYGEWTFGWRTRFFDSYFFDIARTVDPSQGAAGVPRQMYHDFYGGYRFAPGSASSFSVLADIEIRFGINNVFDKAPPIDVVRGGGLMYSGIGDPRLANYYVTLRKDFGQ